MRCPHCGTSVPFKALPGLNFGARRYGCRGCGFWLRMNPYAYLKWSLLPLAAMLLASLIVLAGGFVAFVVAVLAIRIAWVFIAPRLVPLERVPLKATAPRG